MHCHLRAMTNLTSETQNTSDAFVTWNRPLFLSGRVLFLVLTNNFIVFCFQLGNSNSDIDTPTPPSSFHRRGSSRGSMRKVLPPGRNFNINLDSVICIEKKYIYSCRRAGIVAIVQLLKIVSISEQGTGRA